MGREPPVSAFLLGMNLIVRFWSETHRSSRRQCHSLVLGHTVKFGQLQPFVAQAKTAALKPKAAVELILPEQYLPLHFIATHGLNQQAVYIWASIK